MTDQSLLLSLNSVFALTPNSIHDLPARVAKYLLGELAVRQKYPKGAARTYDTSSDCKDLIDRLDHLWVILLESGILSGGQPFEVRIGEDGEEWW